MEKTISLIIPVYNEAQNIFPFYLNLKKIFEAVDYDHEIIFINDGSRDNSMEILNELMTRDDKIKCLEFSKNFGKEIALTAGINHCQGDACLLIDADFQHPVELIPKFIDEWEKGAEQVIGIKDHYSANGFARKICSKAYYQVMKMITDREISCEGTDFRLLDRLVIDQFNRFTERNRISRGLLDWLGYKKEYIHFVPLPRKNGKPVYNFFKLTRLAIFSMVSLSLFPLKLAGYLGLLIMFFSGTAGIIMIVEKYLLKDYFLFNFSNVAILAVIILFLTGIILSCLGLIALYIANIHNEVINRPIYIIKKNHNFSK